MKYSLFSFFILSVFIFSSCENSIILDNSKMDESKVELRDGDKEEWDKGSEDKKDCFELVYPVTYTLPDGSTVTCSDEEEVWSTIKSWYETNPNSKKEPLLQYPVQITFKGEISKTINNAEEMEAVKEICEGKADDKVACFKLVYPVTYTMPDGSVFTGKDEKKVWEAIKVWYIAHPDSKEKPALQYPVEISFEDGTTKTINSNEEMIDTKKACEDKDDE